MEEINIKTLLPVGEKLKPFSNELQMEVKRILEMSR